MGKLGQDQKGVHQRESSGRAVWRQSLGSKAWTCAEEGQWIYEYEATRQEDRREDSGM